MKRHSGALGSALGDWNALPSCSWGELESDPARVRLPDQILYRFMKLQDAVGEWLVPATLAWLAEPYEVRQMRDRLDRQERIGYLAAMTWLVWRDVRNRLADEYPDQPELRWAALRAALAAAQALHGSAPHWLGKLPPPGLPRRHRPEGVSCACVDALDRQGRPTMPRSGRPMTQNRKPELPETGCTDDAAQRTLDQFASSVMG